MQRCATWGRGLLCFLTTACFVFVAVLKSMQLIDGLSDYTVDITPNAALNTCAVSDVCNVKSDLMRLLANLVYQHSANQHMVNNI